MKTGIKEVLSKQQLKRYQSMQSVQQWFTNRQIASALPVVVAMENVLDLDPMHENKYVRIIEERPGRVYTEDHISRAWQGLRCACSADASTSTRTIARTAFSLGVNCRDYRSTLPAYLEAKEVKDEEIMARLTVAANDALDKLDECGDYGSMVEFDLAQGLCWEYRLYPTYLLDLAYTAVSK